MNLRSAKQLSAMYLKRISLFLIATLMLLSPATGVIAGSNDGVTHEMRKVTPYEFNGDVRELSRFPLTAHAQRRPYLHPIRKMPRTKRTTSFMYEPSSPSLNINAPLAPMPGTAQNFAGLSFNDLCTDGSGTAGGGWPPDPNGDVGRDHYIQAVNDAYAVYSKTTGLLLASFTEDSLWSTTGQNPCNGNSQGDPVVLYDQLADRWILTHFAFAFDSGDNPVAPFYECIAVSKTSDPIQGGWWLYPLRMDPGGPGRPPVGTLNDYSKFGIWPDCLYMAANGFSNTGFEGVDYASFSRSDLESGAPLTWSLGFVNNASDPFTMIPGNLLGSSSESLPPAGTPNYFVSETAMIPSPFTFEVRKFTAGPNCGDGGTLSAPVSVSQDHYAIPNNTNIVSQPGTANTLDMIDDRMMQKVQYRIINGVESLWVVHSVLTSSTGTVAPQWAQIDVTGGTIAPVPVQQQIYTPDTTLHRWMGSLAVDNSGNMALGYSTSNGIAPNYPSIAYSGRLASDPPNTLPQTEVQLVSGNGSQTLLLGGQFVQRWGDYTSMSMDPADDCTFWYTNQYYSNPANGSSGNWQTRIGSFKFPSCVPAAPSPPVVTTAAITDIAETSASGGGDVVSAGGATVTERGVCWSLSTDPTTTTDTCTSDGAGTGIFTSSITGLTLMTAYHVRAFAVNSAGTAYGSDVQFTTSGPVMPAPARPTVTTAAIAVAGDGTTAEGGGSVLSEGAATVIARGVCWSTSANPTRANSCTVDGAGAGPFTSSIIGLTLYTKYHARAYATSSAGTAYGNDVTFSTGLRPRGPTGLTVR
jgi:hypothetical protein